MRTVKAVFFLLVFFSSVQAASVQLEKGWNPRHIARQFTGEPEDFKKFLYIDPAGRDITNKVFNPQTGRELPGARHLRVGTLVVIPAELIRTQAFDPSGKDLLHLCSENKTWDCRKVEVSNHIPNMRTPLTQEIRVFNSTSKLSRPAKPVAFHLAPVQVPAGSTLEYKKILSSLVRPVWGSDDVITAAVIVGIIFLAAVVISRLEWVSGAVENAGAILQDIRFHISDGYRVLKLLPDFHTPPLKITDDMGPFAEAERECIYIFQYSARPTDYMVSKKILADQSRMDLVFIPTRVNGHEYPNMRDHAVNMFQTQALMRQQVLQFGVVPLGNPTESWVWHKFWFRKGVKFKFQLEREDKA